MKNQITSQLNSQQIQDLEIALVAYDKSHFPDSSAKYTSRQLNAWCKGRREMEKLLEKLKNDQN